MKYVKKKLSHVKKKQIKCKTCNQAILNDRFNGYCSRLCENNNSKKSMIAESPCRTCGRIIRYTNERKIYCSENCKNNYGKNILFSKKQEIKYCEQCNRELFRKRYGSKMKNKNTQERFCSKACFYLWTSENITGDKTNSWQGGTTSLDGIIRTLSKYRRWKKYILQRDIVCVLCGSDDGVEVDHIIGLKQMIDKYHITNSKEANKCKELWDVKNGRVLCDECHKNTETYGWKSYNKNKSDVPG